MAKTSRTEHILIVGAGAFGLSTALGLRDRGYENITIVDRFLPPVCDGSSNDISRTIRSDYTDPFYARLATEAIETWKSSRLFGPHYHHVGFLLTSEAAKDAYLETNKKNLAANSQAFQEFPSTKEIRNAFPGLEGLAHPLAGYLNPNAGWADAGGAIRALAAHLAERGVSFVTGPGGTVRSLVTSQDSQVTGVNVASGPPIRADKVILATGAWTNRYLDLEHAVIASAQPLGFIQLTPTEAQQIAKIPVTINTTNGVFIFPPNPDNILKVAYHGHGFEVQVAPERAQDKFISAPKHYTNNAASTYLPEDADRYLRYGLRQLVPGVAEKPWSRGRLCWYTETPTCDFVADYHHSMGGLFIATGGSGHGFKFLPVLGNYIADCFEGKASAEVQRRWKLPHPSTGAGKIAANDGSRRGPPRRMLNKAEQARL